MQRDDIKKDKEESNSGKDNEHYVIIFFQPDDDFYRLSFEERLKIVKEKIQHVIDLIKNLPRNYIYVFVAAEYLFKKFNEKGQNRYFTVDEKRIFKQEIGLLSKGSNLIIIPGTICWFKTKDKDGLNYFRNTAYLFYNGTVSKYHKRHLACSDDDFFNEKNKNLAASLKRFKTSKHSSPILSIGEKIIGMEICLDHANSRLSTAIKKLEKKGRDTKLNMHLILADCMQVEPFIADNIVFVKVERLRSNASLGFKSLIGNVCFSPQGLFPALLRPKQQKLEKNLSLHRIFLIQQNDESELVAEFKALYLEKYYSQRLRNPFNTMRQMLENNKSICWADIKYYVATNKNSLAANIYHEMLDKKFKLDIQLKK